ncbi:MAG: GWxTD domain-containing protein [Flavobacteriales bacterium]
MSVSKQFFLFLAFSVCAFNSFAALQVNFDYKTFLDPTEGTYLETHLNFIGGTMTYVPTANGNLEAKIEALILIKQGEEIVDFEKVVLSSPEAIDSAFVDFLDLRRFLLPVGKYELELELTDLNLPEDELEPIFYSSTIEIPNYNRLSCSDIIFMSGFGASVEANDLSRSGYDVLPKVSSYFEGSDTQLAFYAEVYNSKEYFNTDKFLIVHYLENASLSAPIESSKSIKKYDPSMAIPLIQRKDISFLDEGIYNLVIEIRDQQNQVQASKRQEFIRSERVIFSKPSKKVDLSNTFVSEYDNARVLYEYVRSLSPKATVYENWSINKSLSEDSDVASLQSFLYTFWEARNPEDPAHSWYEYQLLLEEIEKEFGSTVKKGYETDRGRVYLEYGPPNGRYDKQISGAQPFEIWHYYQAKQFRNRRFVFMDNDKVLNDYELIQCDVPGEVRNANWLDMLITGIQTNRVNNQGDDMFNRSSNSDGARDVIKDLYLNPR